MRDLILQRYSDNGDSTLGLFFVNDDFFSYCLEDEFREHKISGETRIPAGRYRLRIKNETTPLTQKYRKKFSWFSYHIEVAGIDNFKNVYIHIGNYDENTDGCILLGDGANNNQIQKGMITYSTDAYERFYKGVYPLLEKGDSIFINIKDETDLFR